MTLRPLGRALLLALVAGTAGVAGAQVTPPPVTLPGLPGTPPPTPTDTDTTVRPLIPDVISLQRPKTDVTFDISPANYPPTQFPARYVSAPQAFSVFSSAAKPWTVQMEVHPQPDTQGRTLPVGQLHFRVNGGPWQDATGAPQVVLSQVGPSQGWLPLNVEFALDLTGHESGGGYAFDVAFTALVLP